MKYIQANDEGLRILISCYGCGPNWGSEVGMGWNWVVHLSSYCQLHVITETGFRADLEKEIPKLNLRYQPIFYYIDIEDRGRDLFWKQETPFFYKYYKLWQKKAFILAKELITKEKISIIHQLNLIGFREPGYLWKLSKELPFIWGPVGGFNQVPFTYIFAFDLKNKLFYFGKQVLHFIQLHFHKRVKNALHSAKFVFAESSTTVKIIKKIYRIDATLMNETGSDISSCDTRADLFLGDCMNLLWVGKLQGRKGLPIALKTIKNLKEKGYRVYLTIIGDGPDEKICKKLVKKLELSREVSFLGKIPNNEVKDQMKKHDLLFFTSVKEGTPHVVLEALSNGLPVLCHDACGQGDIINEQCGRKIPMISYSTSIRDFTNEIEHLYNNRTIFETFSIGTKKFAETYSWNGKAQEMFEFYKKALKTN